MFIQVYDVRNLMLYSRLTAGSTSDDVERSITALERLASASAARPGSMTTIISSVADLHTPPDAWQRRRMASALSRIPLQRYALITNSAVAESVMTAIAWLSTSLSTLRFTCTTYERARPWLVQTTSHPAALFDGAHEQIRYREQDFLRARLAS